MAGLDVFFVLFVRFAGALHVCLAWFVCLSIFHFVLYLFVLFYFVWFCVVVWFVCFVCVVALCVLFVRLVCLFLCGLRDSVVRFSFV